MDFALFSGYILLKKGNTHYFEYFFLSFHFSVKNEVKDY